jgi:hypothetical protein
MEHRSFSVNGIDFPHTKTVRTYPVIAYHPNASEPLTVDLVMTSVSGSEDVYDFENQNREWGRLSVAEESRVKDDILNQFKNLPNQA